jgi:hypothetical protein
MGPVLNSTRAVELSVYVVRAFVLLREMLASNKELARRFAQLETRLDKNDEAIAAILSAIRQLMHPPVHKRRPIGCLSCPYSKTAALRPQNVTSNSRRGGRRYRPYAFTEQGVAMLSSVLNSDRAIAINIQIMRAFVHLRGLLASNKELARRFAQLETRVDKKLSRQDEAIGAILSAIRQLMNSPAPQRRGIGFTANLDE